MKQASNNEVDLLLRALGRRGRKQPSATNGGGSQVATSHLDADELNAYAEGVLPERARERYTQHLADCDRCRGIVFTLSQSAGTSARLEAQKEQTGTSFWSTLAALFSPAVLRYAVPALALTAIIGISFVALRQQRESSLVARNEGNQAAPPAVDQAATPAVNDAVGPQQPAPALRQGPEASPSSLISIPSEQNKDRDKKAELQDKETTAASAVAPAELAKRENRELPVASKSAESEDDSRPKYAPEPKAPPAPAATIFGETARPSSSSRDASAGQDRVQQQEGYKAQAKDERSGPSRSRTESYGRRVDGLTASGPQKSGEAMKRKSDSDVVETRVVSGRRFRREGAAWVDTAYDSSRSTLNVARGSEHFRTLLADEPGLRAIAEQLGGEVIVVWKGRAYRFR